MKYGCTDSTTQCPSYYFRTWHCFKLESNLQQMGTKVDVLLVKLKMSSAVNMVHKLTCCSCLTLGLCRCLTVAPEDRPDILELCSGLTDLLLVYIDNLRVSQTSLQRKLDRERKRTQK